MAAKITALKPTPDPNPTATLYRAVRDAARMIEGVPHATRVAVLEQVKWELLRDLQSQIDEE